MDSRNADLLKDIDPSELGQRIRALRVAKGWTQTDLAGGDISVGYVPRIESWQRRRLLPGGSAPPRPSRARSTR